MGFDLRTRVIGVIAISASGIFAVVACGSAPAPNPSIGCEPGTKETCTGPNLCSGKQVCKSDRTYDVCVCPPIPDASVFDSGDPPPVVDASIDAPIKDAGFDAKPFDPKPLSWIKDVDMTYIASIAVDGNHDVLVGGQGGFGNITKLDATGTLLWQKYYLSQNTVPATVLAVTGDAVGNGYVFLDSPPSINYGGGTITQSGRVLLRLDANGIYAWHYGPFTQGVLFTHLVTRPNGNIVLAGQLEGTADFGSGNVTSNGASDGLVVELTPNKTLVKVRQFGDAGYQSIRSVALDPSGNAYVVGVFNGTIDFGKGVMTGPPANGSFSAPHSVFVAKLDPSLNGVAQKDGAATVGADYLTEVAIDPFGNVGVAGVVQSSIKLGAKAVSAFTAGDLYFGYLDGSLSEIWSGGYGGYAGQALSGFAARPGGAFIAAGFTNGTLSFGLGGLPVGTPGYFLVQFDTAGNPISNFGGSVTGGSVTPQVMSYLGGTDYVLGAVCQGGTLVLPSGSHPCTSKAFVTRFAP